MAKCRYAPTTTGNERGRCYEQAIEGRMYCAACLKAAMQRVRLAARDPLPRIRKQARGWL